MDAARPSLTLHGSKTSRAFRAHWCLRELGLDYELNLISGRGGGTVTPEFLAINPKGQIPFLEDRATGVSVGESGAVLLYLAERYSSPTRRLLPPDGDPGARYRHLSWCFYFVTELDRPIWSTLSATLARGAATSTAGGGKGIGEGEGGGEGDSENLVLYRRKVTVVEDELRRHGQEYVLGAQFTVADILLCHTLMFARLARFEIPPCCTAQMRACQARPGFKAADSVEDPFHGGRSNARSRM